MGMTTTSLRATVRRRINQTSNSNTQFSDSMIDELGNQARRMFASILPESILGSLRTSTDLSPSSGQAAYPNDYLRSLNDPHVEVDNVYAAKIPENEKWRLRYLESNANVDSDTNDKYYWETDDGINCLPSDATTITFPYLKKPADLDTNDNTDMPPDVDDMVVDFVFEKLMGTRRGNVELANILAQSRGYLTRTINQKEAV